MENLNKIKVPFLVSCILSSCFLIFCSKNSTNPETVTFSGTVTLEERTDHSGVKVSLYKPVELDTALMRIKQQYPNIGVQISQETEFDHREHTPVKSTTTNASGSWKIEGIEPGTYNVVAEKDSFGWRYLYNTNIVSQNMIELYREKYLNGILNEDFIFQVNRHYVIKSDVVLGENYTFTFVKGSWIKFLSSTSLEIYGKLNSSGDDNTFTHFTSNSKTPVIGDWKYLRLNQLNNSNLENIHVQFSNSGIRIEGGSKIKLSGVYSKENSSNGMIINQVDEINVINSILRNNERGLLIQFSSFSEIKNSIIKTNQRGLMLDNSGAVISSNYFDNNNIGIYSLGRSGSNVKNNNFYHNNWGVFCAGTNVILRLNYFYEHSDCIHIATDRTYSNSEPVINFNNFINCTFVIKLLGTATSPNIYDVNAEYNWWDTNNVVQIQQLIWDKNDVNIDTQYVGNVIYNFYKTAEIDSAGINNY